MDQENIIAELQAKIKALEEQIAKLEAALEYESLPDRVKDARNAQSKLDEALYEDSIKSVMYALREGADVNRMIGRHFPIVYASLYCKPDIVEALLQNGADVNVRNEGRTSLQHAAWMGYTDIVFVLLDDPNIDLNAIDNDGNTALHLSVFNDCKDVYEMLIDVGADTSIVNKDGETAADIYSKHLHQ